MKRIVARQQPGHFVQGVELLKVERCALDGMTIAEIAKACETKNAVISLILAEYLPPEVTKERNRIRKEFAESRKRNADKEVNERLVAECAAIHGMTISQISHRCGVPVDKIRELLYEKFPPVVNNMRLKQIQRKNMANTRASETNENRLSYIAEETLAERDDLTEEDVLQKLRETRLIVKTSEELNLDKEIVEFLAQKHDINVVNEKGTKIGGYRTDKQLLAGLLQAFKEASSNGQYLTVKEYDKWAKSQPIRYPTFQIIQKRFGSWSKGCEAAGVPIFLRDSGKPPNKWTAESCKAWFDQWIRECQENGTETTVAAYNNWIKNNEAPSHTTIRKYLTPGATNWYVLCAEGIARVCAEDDQCQLPEPSTAD